MRHQRHKRSPLRSRLLALVAVLVVGGGGAVAITQVASAHFGGSDRADRSDGFGGHGGHWGESAGWWWGTIRCPDVGQELEEIPAGGEEEVGEDLAALDAQVAEAYADLATEGGVPEEVLATLDERRSATLDEMAETLGSGPGDFGRPWFDRFGPCEIVPPRDSAPEDPELPEDPGQVPVGGPVPEDFVDITTVEPNVVEPAPGPFASTGSVTVDCGVNENGHFNSDNVIANPGVSNGAHHVHDYVGNLSTDAFSTDETLAAAETTCVNGDQSTHYWPVLRVRDGTDEVDARLPGGGLDHNTGRILTPASVTLTFRGSPLAPVTEMPRFLRVITGDAKAFTNGVDNANASWSCTGFEDRQLTDRYPLCPEGSQVVRTFAFQSCWDGVNTDSANHRDHVAFAAEDGSCPPGFTAIPQLVHRITYDIPPEALDDVPFAVDSFPEQLHKPVTDHSDFINVMSRELMAQAVSCINSGTDCG